MNNKDMLVTIITVSFNSEKTIKDTIESILIQKYKKIEYIIIDGLSKDNTVSIAKIYKKAFIEKGFIYKIISEKDNGLYDAMNKGINLSTGSIIGILNSDDFYINEFVIYNIVNKFILEKSDCVYSDLLFVNQYEKDKIVRKWVSGIGTFKFGWDPPHPATFFKKSVYKKFGLYDTTYKISADYEFMYRVIFGANIKLAYFNEFTVKMRQGGKSTNGIKSHLHVNKEVYKIMKKYGRKFPLFVLLLRLFRKIKQLI